MRSVGGAWIRTRKTASGPRYQVRYRHGSVKLKHGGSFKTRKEADARRMFILMEQAAGRDPEDSLRKAALAQREKRTVSEWAVLYMESRADLAPTSRRRARAGLAKFEEKFGKWDPRDLTRHDIQSWLNELDVGPASTRSYYATICLLLDFCDCEPNPARDKRVKKPRLPRRVIKPPSDSDIAAMLSEVSEDVRLPLRIMQHTGMRGGEVLSLEWRDVDFRTSRFRLRDGKTNAARRWVKVPRELMEELTTLRQDTMPLSLSPIARVFPLGKNRLRDEMQKAREALGLDPSYSPHKLRHRYGSVEVGEGKTPLPLVSQQMGHARVSTTLDLYSHVLPEDEA